MPLVRERARAQPARDPREPAGQAGLHAGAQHHRARAAARAARPHAALRAARAARRAGRRAAGAAHLRHAHGTGRLPRPHRQRSRICPLVYSDEPRIRNQLSGVYHVQPSSTPLGLARIDVTINALQILSRYVSRIRTVIFRHGGIVPVRVDSRFCFNSP